MWPLNKIKLNLKDGLILNSIFSNVKWKHLELRLFYLYRQKFDDVKDITVKPELHPCILESIGPAEVKYISEKPDSYYSEEKMLRMLSKGWQCLGLKYKNEIISLRWYNFRECDSKLLPFTLNKNEVYLGGALTFSEYRGNCKH